MLTGSQDESFHMAVSLPDAVAALADRGARGAPLAGATWIMRAPLRDEAFAAAYVGLSGIAALRALSIGETEIGIGACVSHAHLARALALLPEVRVLAEAAGRSANPAIREVATVGGNLCSTGFAAADLVPALLCLDAEVELARPGGSDRMALDAFLDQRDRLPPGTVLARVILPRRPGRSAHIRLPLRAAGDYPVAIVSLAVALAEDGRVRSARLAVGSVEPVARRWTALEDWLAGRPLDPAAAAAAAADLAGGFRPRDGIEAPGSYRLRVLPALVGRAVHAVQSPS